MTTANDKPTGKAPAKKAAPARLAPAISALAANRPNLRAAGAPAASSVPCARRRKAAAVPVSSTGPLARRMN